MVVEFLAHSDAIKEDGFVAAAFLADAILLVDKDAQLAPADKATTSELYASTAVEYLRNATAQGYRDADRARKEPRFAPIRERPDFVAWLKTLTQ